MQLLRQISVDAAVAKWRGHLQTDQEIHINHAV
jgi:hypothetical protein